MLPPWTDRKYRYFTILLIFLLSDLNGFLYIADEEIPDSKVVLEPQESVSKVQMRDKKKGTRRDGVIRKYQYDKRVHSLI